MLQTPLQFLKGVGPRKAADLKKAGLNTVEDLLFRFPRRYEDRSRLQKIISLRPGMTAAISGTVLNAGLAHTRRPGFKLFSALVQDESGQIQAVWPNQAFLKDVIRSQQHIVLFGKVEVWGSRGLQITDPEFEIVDIDGARRRTVRSARGTRQSTCSLHTGRIVPVYERTGSVTTNMQRRFVWQALEQLPRRRVRSRCPTTSSTRERWPARTDGVAAGALSAVGHADRRPEQLHDRRRSAGWCSRTSSSFKPVWRCGDRRTRKCASAWCRKVDDRIRQRAREVLPFKLTAGQRDALLEIVTDMQKAWPMQRLLQGDVGAGKTIVALLAAVVAMENGFQVAVMAPTEILAEQHYRTIVKTLARADEAISRGAAQRPRDRGDAARSVAGDRARRDQPRGRHAGAGPGARQVQGAGAGRDRRAASLRRGAARHAGGQGRATRTCW